MPPLTSGLFSAITIASPEDAWAALTSTGSPLGYLYGLTAESDWRSGATLAMALDQWRVVGEVLVADRPRRLSYTLGDRHGEPSVYVTWEVRALDDATVIRLAVDEVWPLTDDFDDLEAAWLPVLAGLVTQLGMRPGTAGDEQEKVSHAGEFKVALESVGQLAIANDLARAPIPSAVHGTQSS